MDLAEIARKIRKDKDLGIGSCSHIDECCTDTEFMELIGEQIDRIRETGRRPSYKAIRELLFDREVLLWEQVGIKWPQTNPQYLVNQRLANIGYGSSEALRRH